MPPTNSTSRSRSRSWLPSFLAGLSLGLLVWQWRQRRDVAEISRQRLEGEAESDRLRLRLTSLQEVDAPAAPVPAAPAAEPVIDLTDTAPVATVSTINGNGNGSDNGTAAHHDDLKRIKGIGPKMEQSLNDLGIHTFEQLANLSKVDIDRLTTAIAAFPGRIERDDWVGSARRLLQAEQPSDSPLF